MIRKRTALAIVAATLMSASADAGSFYARQSLVRTDQKPEPPKDPPSVLQETSIVLRVVSGSDCLQVAEIEVYANGVNVAAAAAGGVATGTAPYDPATGPGRAIDGVRPASYPNIYHSVCGGSPTLRVVFPRAVDVERVVAYGRADSYQHRDIYSYEITGRSGVRTGILDAREGPATSIPS